MLIRGSDTRRVSEYVWNLGDPMSRRRGQFRFPTMLLPVGCSRERLPAAAAVEGS